MLDCAAGANPMDLTIYQPTGFARLGMRSKASAVGPRAWFGESKLSCEILSGRDAGALVCQEESRAVTAMRHGRRAEDSHGFLNRVRSVADTMR